MPVVNVYGASEIGGHGVLRRGPGLHLSEDLAIVEPVDAAGARSPPGVRSDKIYVTNLFNYTLPLIRYEVTDQLTVLDGPCPCGSAHRLIADPQGRLDDASATGRSDRPPPRVPVAAGSPAPRGRRVPGSPDRPGRGHRPCGSPTPIDVAALAAEIAAGLARARSGRAAGDRDVVDQLRRQYSGKLKRFVPLPAG